MDGHFHAVGQVWLEIQTSMSFTLSEVAAWGWRRIALEKGIPDDACLAAFLVKHYEETQRQQRNYEERQSQQTEPSRCVSCNTPLSQFCPNCFTLSSRQEQQDQQAHNRQTDQGTQEQAWQKITFSPVRDTMTDFPNCEKEQASPGVVSDLQTSDDEGGDIATDYDGDTDVEHSLTSSQTFRYGNEQMKQAETQADVSAVENNNVAKQPQGKDRLPELFKCDICKQTFSDPDVLVMHMQEHCDQMVHECGECKARFFHAEILELHRDIHSKQKKYPCDQCHASYCRIDNLTKHKSKKHHGKPMRGKNSHFLKQPVNHVTNNSKCTNSQGQSEGILDECGTKFKCDQCGKEFHKKNHLQRHVLTHSKEKQYGCQQCGASFAHMRSLVVHMHTHDTQKPVQCGKCHQYLSAWTRMTKHVCKLKTPCKLQCESCGKKFMTSGQLILHSRLHHSSDKSSQGTARLTKKASAEKGKSPTDQKSSAQKSSVETKTARPRECPLKAKTLNNSEKDGNNVSSLPNVTPDMQTVTAEKDKQLGNDTHPHCCQFCGARFMFSSHLTRHIQDHTGEKAFKCSQCDLSFRTQFFLMNHVRSHKATKDFPCHYCGKVLKSSYTLKLHLSSHTGEKPFKCDKCSATFAIKGTYKAHLLKHSGDRPYLCPHCGKSFIRSNNLSAHIRTHSDDRKDYPCHYCGKILRSVYTLRAHLRSHTGERPYKCDDCGASFSLNSTYKAHLRKHTGARPYLCPHCGKSFVHSSNLTVHLRIHTGEKPYKCKLCPMAFTIPNSLTEHMRKHTGDKPFKCSICGKGFSKSCNRLAHYRTHKNKQNPVLQPVTGVSVPTSV